MKLVNNIVCGFMAPLLVTKVELLATTVKRTLLQHARKPRAAAARAAKYGPRMAGKFDHSPVTVARHERHAVVRTAVRLHAASEWLHDHHGLADALRSNALVAACITASGPTCACVNPLWTPQPASGSTTATGQGACRIVPVSIRWTRCIRTPFGP
jgi:hypothetical protein